uniref:Uncharacterized protein n=1 Tax=Nelumbo nucifera TaxID=4432 RepID=A0A822ZD23_NELNU|nr:TPA_asm: hypothetical protein HUJ06_015712 [Nelumbo nucifera]
MPKKKSAWACRDICKPEERSSVEDMRWQEEGKLELILENKRWNRIKTNNEAKKNQN